MSINSQAFDLALEPLVIAGHVGAGLLAAKGVPESFISGTAFPAVGVFREKMQMRTGGVIASADNGGTYSRNMREDSAEEEFEDTTNNFLVSREVPAGDPHPRTAEARYAASVGTGNGSWLAVAKVRKPDGTETDPFVTFLGAPVVAAEAFASGTCPGGTNAISVFSVKLLPVH